MKLDDVQSVVDSWPEWKRNYQVTEYLDNQNEKLNMDPDLDPGYVSMYFNHNEAN